MDSWKEIAAYLKRDVRTVQRWEKQEGLPVHRHLHAKLGSLYAFKSELDVWWQDGHDRIDRLDAGAGETSDSQPSSESGPLAANPEHRLTAGFVEALTTLFGAVERRLEEMEDNALVASHSCRIARDRISGDVDDCLSHWRSRIHARDHGDTVVPHAHVSSRLHLAGPVCSRLPHSDL